MLYLNQYTCVKLELAVTVQPSWTEDPVVTVYVGCETDTTGTLEWRDIDKVDNNVMTFVIKRIC